MNNSTDRRDFLRTSAFFAGAGALLGGTPLIARAAQNNGGKAASVGAGAAGRTRVLRVAHLTDLHMQPERGAADGLAECLAKVEALSPKPDLILTGGDLIMDGFAADKPRTLLQWELLTKTIADHTGIPVEHTLGNHDIWGWNKSKSGCTGDEPLWGKKWALDTLKLEKPYRSFDRGSWHFVVLDSVQHDPEKPEGYIGKIDEAQMAWLESDLKAAAAKPTLVVSHMPILSATVLVNKPNRPDGDRYLEGGAMHIDTRELIDLFARTRGEKSGVEGLGGVKTCLSGHIHLLDRVDYNGVTYYCDGAVCGKWWKGRNTDCEEGFAVLDLFSDGTVERTYVTYGWKAREE